MSLDFGTVICPDCDGHGTTRYGGKDCPRCRGRGEVLACTECDGAGWWTEYEDDDDPADPGEEVTCAYCHGTGAEPLPPPQD